MTTYALPHPFVYTLKFTGQVPAVSSSLNSGDAFIVVTKEKVFVWTGKYASTAELEVAQNIGHILVNYLEWTGRLLESIEEGNEPEEFWIALGGKGPYAEYREGEAAMREPRLFHVLGFGSAVEEVYNFEQEDLLIEDCFILDVYTQVHGGGWGYCGCQEGTSMNLCGWCCCRSLHF